MNQTNLLYVAAIVVVIVALLLLYLLRGRRQHVVLRDQPATLARAARPSPMPAAPATSPAVPLASPVAADEGHGVADEVTAAFEDVLDQFVGIDAHPSGQEQAPVHGDVLTRLKGLGPKAASLLTELGVTRYAQIAAWDDRDVAAIDGQMGAFKGRIRRDRWVEQAQFLATGDVEGFEAQFGKLGG